MNAKLALISAHTDAKMRLRKMDVTRALVRRDTRSDGINSIAKMSTNVLRTLKFHSFIFHINF